MTRPQAVVVLVTVPSRAVGRRLAQALVQRRLAACVNLVTGVESVFRWKGKVDRCREVLLLMKTTRSRFRRLSEAVQRLHPYEVPEVLALRVTAGANAYLVWVAQSTSIPRTRRRRTA